MDFVSEEIIESTAAELGKTEESIKAAMLELDNELPVISAYLFSENFDLLTQPEKEYLLFLALTIFKSAQKVDVFLPKITEEQLGAAEEKNWELLTAVTFKKFRERMDVFFKDYQQEDLLAFVEDSLTEEEEEELVTKVGREPMFVALKSIIDVLCVS